MKYVATQGGKYVATQGRKYMYVATYGRMIEEMNQVSSALLTPKSHPDSVAALTGTARVTSARGAGRLLIEVVLASTI